MNPQFAPAHQTLGWAYLNQGKHRQAIREFQQAIQLSGTDDMEFTVDLGCAYAVAGNREQATTILTRLEKEHDRGRVSSASIAVLYGALGELNEAFAWLDSAYKEHAPELTYLKVPTRRYQPVRNDPRYNELFLRMGLSDSSSEACVISVPASGSTCPFKTRKNPRTKRRTMERLS